MRRTPNAAGRLALRLLLAFVPPLFLAACGDGAPSPLTSQALVSTTLEVPISNSADDAEESAAGGVNRTSLALELVYNAGNQTVGLRFNELAIPQGATVSRAYVQFTADKAGSGDTALTVQAEAWDNAPMFQGKAYNVSSRPRTVQRVTWAPQPWGVGEKGPAQQTPDLAAVVQEVVNRPGWASGNSLALIITGTGQRIAKPYDRSSADAPRLHLEYTVDHMPPRVDSFGVSATAAKPDEAVTFSWAVADPENQPLSCTLDVNDDGTPEYEFVDCKAVTQQTHKYSAGGEYVARLEVTDSDAAIAEATVTVNVADTTSSVVVAAAGDVACDPTSTYFNGTGSLNHCQMRATSNLMLEMNLDAVLPLGDNAYEQGTLGQYTASYDPSWGRLKNITYPAVGNHEYLTPNASGYFQYFGAAAGDPTQGYYSFDLGGWHIVVLNSSCSQAGGCKSWSPQAQWLRNDLAAHPAPCTLALWHIPRFSSGRIGNRDFTQDLWSELYNAGADLVLTGHDHNYERFAPQTATGQLDPERGLREFVVGTGGKSTLTGGVMQPNSEAFNNNTPGVLKLTLKPTGYDWAFVPIPGKTFSDSGSGVCH